ncbi:MAG: hypothetical protein NT047_00970 [Deltaproteobacteria bacterium]|nr:hypothetical protein [Deltaproteobacteria bacterium]
MVDVGSIETQSPRRGLVQNFKEEHRHLMRGIPGIQDMVSKFK